MSKLLTIIIPSYNMEMYLGKNLKTLVLPKDKMEKLEVIIVNDGSKDRTSEIAHEFERVYDEVVSVIDKDNGNYGSCVNAGLEKAMGTFVKILDADDSFHTANLEKFIAELEASELNREEVDLFMMDYHTVDENGKMIKYYGQELPAGAVISVTDADASLFETIQHHGIAYRTDLLKKNKYFQSEGISYTDQEWITIPLLYVKKIKYVPLDLYAYLLGRSGQTMDSCVIAKSAVAHVKVGSAMLDIYLLKQYTPDSLNLNIVKTRLVKYFEYIYKMFLITNTSAEARKEIEEFDTVLSDLSSEMYFALDEFILSKKLPMKYIQYWRKKGYNCVLKTVSGLYRH